jgi:Serine/threonine protein phosphatase
VLEGDDFASARHARIESRGDGVWVQDLDSTNGTYVNGARVMGAQRLDPGDVLRVGETDLRWRRSDVPVAAYAVASDTGRRRRHNEDDYVVSPPLFAVADGMGGAQAGEVASGLAAGALKGGDSNGLDGPAQVDALIQEANRLIYDRASNDPTASGMGTTVTVALVEGMTVVIGHVGDSRATSSAATRWSSSPTTTRS